MTDTCSGAGLAPTASDGAASFFPDVTELAASADVGAGKSLLVRSTRADVSAHMRIVLRPLVTEPQWRTYTEQRIQVEKGFGATGTDARRMVHQLHGRCTSFGLGMFAVEHDYDMVAAIGRFRMPAPDHHCARLQDIDVFPDWRGHGFGTAMLMATLRMLESEGSAMVVVGADEDDRPLTWYRRHGFYDVARVRKRGLILTYPPAAIWS